MIGDYEVEMVDSIIGDSVLLGKTKTETLKLLGSPTASDTIGSMAYVVDLGKKVGPLGLGGKWLFYLTIEFDSNSIVKLVRCND